MDLAVSVEYALTIKGERVVVTRDELVDLHTALTEILGSAVGGLRAVTEDEAPPVVGEWDREEVRVLADMLGAERPLAVIAEMLGRGVEDCRAMAAKLAGG